MFIKRRKKKSILIFQDTVPVLLFTVTGWSGPLPSLILRYHPNISEYSCGSKSRIREFGNRLFCAWLRVHFYEDICQSLAASVVRSSLYQYSHRNYDPVCTKLNLKSDFHITGQMMETHPEYSIRFQKYSKLKIIILCIKLIRAAHLDGSQQHNSYSNKNGFVETLCTPNDIFIFLISCFYSVSILVISFSKQLVFR